MPNRARATLGVAIPVIFIGCGMPSASNIELPRATPGLELQTEDYAHARSSFRTNLVRTGPAPHQGEPLKRPHDAQEIEYGSGELRLKAYLGLSANDGRKRPAVLVLHGGFAYGEGQWEMARPFRDAGFVVMMPVLRGENGQAGDFTLFYDEVDEVLAAADALASLPSVDASRIYVCGHSVGGTLTLLAAMASNRFRAASSLSGSPDLESYLRVGRVQVPFDHSDIREVRLRSPVAYAASFKCPVRLFCGDEEFWVQGSTQRTAMLAKQHGIDAEAIEVPGDHFSAVAEAIRQTISFFREQ
jgi:dipeptidyl aminopeptidase/acylaminoacyl peptidase